MLFSIFKSAKFLPIDEYVKETLPINTVTYICRNTFIPSSRSDLEVTAGFIEKEEFHFLILGGEPYQKGIDVALLALKKVRNELNVKVRVSIFGMPKIETKRARFRYLTSQSYRDCVDIIESFKSYDWVKFRDFSNDRDLIFEGKDMLLFTSRLNAPGRPVIEACFYGILNLYCTTSLVDNCFADVSNCCICEVDEVKNKIIKIIKDELLRSRSKDFSRVIKLHSPDAQARVLQRVYEVEVCEK